MQIIKILFYSAQSSVIAIICNRYIYLENKRQSKDAED